MKKKYRLKRNEEISSLVKQNKIKKSRVVTLVTEPPQTIPLLLRSINNL